MTITREFPVKFFPKLARKPQGLHTICRKRPGAWQPPSLPSLSSSPSRKTPLSGRPRHSQAVFLSLVDIGKTWPPSLGLGSHPFKCKHQPVYFGPL